MRVNPGPIDRVVRAALFAIVCVGSAAVLHGMTAGYRVSWLAIGLGFVPICVAAYAGLGRERSGGVLTAGLGFAQVGLHVLFSQVCPTPVPGHPLTSMSMPPMPGMDALGMGTSGAGAVASANAASAAANTIAMLAAHVIAVLVCGWWMGRGEREYFALCRALILLVTTPVHRFLAAILAALAVVPPRWYLPAACKTPAVSDRRPFQGSLCATLTFRGPPVCA